MKNSIFLPALLLVATLIACKEKPTPPPAPDPRLDFSIVPGERFGLLTAANCTREGVLATYGDSAKVDSIYLYEGIMGKGIVLFPNNPRRTVTLFWEDEFDPKRPAFIRISGDSTGVSDWKTADGITLGMTLADVEKLNGKPFFISGFGWDFGGQVTDWNNGKINATALAFQPGTDKPVSEKILGEGVHPSDDPDIRAASPLVSMMTFRILAKETLPDCIAALVQKNQNPGKMVVKKFILKDAAHYWLSDGAAAYDGIEHVFDGNCQEVCQMGGMRRPPACANVYEGGKWEIIWEE